VGPIVDTLAIAGNASGLCPAAAMTTADDENNGRTRFEWRIASRSDLRAVDNT